MCEKKAGAQTNFPTVVTEMGEIPEVFLNFIRGIVHDLNNILMILGNYSLAWPDSKISPEERLSAINAELQRVGALIGSLSHLGKGRLPPNYSVDLNSNILENYLLLVNVVSYTNPAVVLEINLAPALPPISVNRTELFQVLENLVRNAAEALEGNPGGTILIRTKLEQIAEKIQVVLEVADNGPGMNREVLKKIGSGFSTKGGNHGQGLSFVEMLVTKFGAASHVISSPGQGTKFMIFFPAINASPPEKPQDTEEFIALNQLAPLIPHSSKE